MTNPNKSYRLLIMVLGIFFLQACGIKFWYNRLDWVVPWYLDDYVELTSEQEDTLEKLLAIKTEWHRSNELPKYVSMLNRMEADIKSGAITQTYERYRRDMRGFYNTLLDEMSDDLVAQTASLTDQQVKQLMDNLDKEAKEQYEELKETKEEDRQNERLERLEDSFSEWIGSLDDKQEELIKEMASLLKSSGEATYQYRAKWRDAFRTALAERTTKSGQAAIKSLITDPYQVGGEEMNQIREYNGNIYKEYQLKIYRTLSAKQKRHLLEEIADYREDFEDLIDD